mmetsp:Transcript_110007/g.312016  ORF Transcript_110007/g.312016 Transcript_110007/m.312016 type:complete len:419 (+) Transcript_110007:377-1633(+)
MWGSPVPRPLGGGRARCYNLQPPVVSRARDRPPSAADAWPPERRAPALPPHLSVAEAWGAWPTWRRKWSVTVALLRPAACDPRAGAAAVALSSAEHPRDQHLQPAHWSCWHHGWAGRVWCRRQRGHRHGTSGLRRRPSRRIVVPRRLRCGGCPRGGRWKGSRVSTDDGLVCGGPCGRRRRCGIRLRSIKLRSRLTVHEVGIARQRGCIAAPVTAGRRRRRRACLRGSLRTRGAPLAQRRLLQPVQRACARVPRRDAGGASDHASVGDQLEHDLGARERDVYEAVLVVVASCVRQVLGGDAASSARDDVRGGGDLRGGVDLLAVAVARQYEVDPMLCGQPGPLCAAPVAFGWKMRHDDLPLGLGERHRIVHPLHVGFPKTLEPVWAFVDRDWASRPTIRFEVRRVVVARAEIVPLLCVW